MKDNNIYKLCVGFACACLLGACSEPQVSQGNTDRESVDTATRPNIVLVITDDQGYGDLGIHGNPLVLTPNIDRLATESVSFTDYHVSPTCSPTRAALLTGHWSNRTGVWHTIMGRSMLREGETTLADLLKANGYHTAIFGKWHLGDNYPYRPMDRGFDQAYYHGGGGVGQTPDFWDNAYFNGSYFRNGIPEAARGFVTDVLFDEAIEYIDSIKDSDQPFFAYISTNAPHAPMHAPQRYAALYKDKGLSTFVQHFFGMITNIDDNIARLRRYLESNHLADNTLFIFTTDNGTAAGEGVFNAGMKGKKGSPYEGGHRVPLFMHWPAGGIAGAQEINTIAAHVDILPTLMDYSGSRVPEGVAFDGRSLRPLIEGREDDWPERVLVTDSQRLPKPVKWRQSAVMTDRWRLINGVELYDINRDPAQRFDLAATHTEVVERLRSFYHDWWAELEPGFGEPTPIFIGAPKANSVDLNAHDWLGPNQQVPWHQGHIRSGLAEEDGRHKGYWWVKVVAAANYEIELRRWPRAADAAIDADLPPGTPVPGEAAYRTMAGTGFKAHQAFIRINGADKYKTIKPDAKSVVFTADLLPGTKKISAGFIDTSGRELGAYFVNIRKL